MSCKYIFLYPGKAQTSWQWHPPFHLNQNKYFKNSVILVNCLFGWLIGFVCLTFLNKSKASDRARTSSSLLRHGMTLRDRNAMTNSTWRRWRFIVRQWVLTLVRISTFFYFNYFVLTFWTSHSGIQPIRCIYVVSFSWWLLGTSLVHSQLSFMPYYK